MPPNTYKQTLLFSVHLKRKFTSINTSKTRYIAIVANYKPRRPGIPVPFSATEHLISGVSIGSFAFSVEVVVLGVVLVVVIVVVVDVVVASFEYLIIN